MARSALALFLSTVNATPEALAALAVDAFSADLLHYVDANNDQRITEAVAALPMGKTKIKGKQNQAIGAAIGAAVKACADALPDGHGWVGAVKGSFSKAGKEARLPYLSAHAIGVQTFADALTASGEFVAPTKKTEAEKAEAKALREEKAAAALAETISAKVAAGELVRAVDVKVYTLADHIGALRGAAIGGELTPEGLQALAEVLAIGQKVAEEAAAPAPMAA